MRIDARRRWRVVVATMSVSVTSVFGGAGNIAATNRESRYDFR